MNIAIVLSGHLRSFEQCKERFQTHFLDPLHEAGHKFETHLHTWDDSPSEDLIKMFNVTWSVVDNFDTFRSMFTEKYNSNQWRSRPGMSGPYTASDASSQLYSMYRAYDLIKSDYDVLIRVRPDFYFKSKFNVAELSRHSVLRMPVWHQKYPEVTKKIMDQFAFGDSKVMKAWFTTYLDLPNYLTNSNVMHTTEGFLYEHIKNLSVVRSNVSFGLHRGHRIEHFV